MRCVAVAVLPSWSGERRANRLDRVLSVVGRPGASRKDGGSALQKAVDVWSERGLGSPVMDDIAHAVATRLKRRYDTHPQCAPLLSAGGRVSSRLQQTVLAWLTPPTVHTTSRLMNVHCLVRWADRVLDLWPAGRATAGAVWANLRSGLDALPACRTLLRQWRDDAVALWACPKILKTHGLTPDTLTQGEPLRDPMASVRVRQEFSRYLQPQRETAQSFGLDAVGVPISSAPLASLFGLTQQHGVGPLKDAHRMALRMPALCGLPTEQEAPQVLAVSGAQQHARADGLSSFTKQRRPMRVHPHHLAQLGHGRAQGNVELIPPGKDRSNRSEIIYFPNGYKGGGYSEIS